MNLLRREVLYTSLVLVGALGYILLRLELAPEPGSGTATFAGTAGVEQVQWRGPQAVCPRCGMPVSDGRQGDECRCTNCGCDSVWTYAVCPTCAGSGDVVCSFCGGQGKVAGEWRQCPVCGGAGRLRCPTCDGEGLLGRR